MSNPQTENGFIQIATGSNDNDVLAALARSHLTGAEFQILLHVMRQTWGYKKKEDWISLSQFQKATDRDRSHIVSCINRLVACKLLVASRQPGKKTVYGFNKLFNEWVVASEPLVASSPRTSSLQPTQLVASRLHTKESLTKETITKENVVSVSPKPPTPADEVRKFFDDELNREEQIKKLVSKGMDESAVREEIKKFSLYWTEKNKSGTKCRWELSPTFELRRRLITWFTNSSKFPPRV